MDPETTVLTREEWESLQKAVRIVLDGREDDSSYDEACDQLETWTQRTWEQQKARNPAY